jgi:hypothetical protein
MSPEGRNRSSRSTPLGAMTIIRPSMSSGKAKSNAALAKVSNEPIEPASCLCYH